MLQAWPSCTSALVHVDAVEAQRAQRAAVSRRGRPLRTLTLCSAPARPAPASLPRRRPGSSRARRCPPGAVPPAGRRRRVSHRLSPSMTRVTWPSIVRPAGCRPPPAAGRRCNAWPPAPIAAQRRSRRPRCDVLPRHGVPAGRPARLRRLQHAVQPVLQLFGTRAARAAAPPSAASKRAGRGQFDEVDASRPCAPAPRAAGDLQLLREHLAFGLAEQPVAGSYLRKTSKNRLLEACSWRRLLGAPG